MDNILWQLAAKESSRISSHSRDLALFTVLFSPLPLHICSSIQPTCSILSRGINPQASIPSSTLLSSPHFPQTQPTASLRHDHRDGSSHPISHCSTLLPLTSPQISLGLFFSHLITSPLPNQPFPQTRPGDEKRGPKIDHTAPPDHSRKSRHYPDRTFPNQTKTVRVPLEHQLESFIFHQEKEEGWYNQNNASSNQGEGHKQKVLSWLITSYRITSPSCLLRWVLEESPCSPRANLGSGTAITSFSQMTSPIWIPKFSTNSSNKCGGAVHSNSLNCISS